MSRIFKIKAGDTLPRMPSTLTGITGAPVPLDTADSITFSMAIDGGTPITPTVNILDGAAGQVELAWASGDTDTVGEYEGEYTITFGADTMTVPDASCVHVHIIAGC